MPSHSSFRGLIYLVILFACLHAAMASAANRDTQWQVTEIYIATMGYAPDAEGLDYWVSNIQTLRQWTSTTVAQSFFDQPLVQAEYPSDQGYGPFIEALYQNIFGRAVDSEGYAYWLGELESGRVQRNQMVIALIEGGWANPGAATDMARFGNRVEVGLAFAEYQRENGILYSALDAEDQAYLREAGSAVLAEVGAADSEREAAIASIPGLLESLEPETQYTWQETFDDPSLSNWAVARGWTGCDDVEPWEPAYFKPFHVQGGSLVIATDPAAFPLGADSWCYRGLPTEESFLTGDFDLRLDFGQFEVFAREGGTWESGLRVRLEEAQDWSQGERLALYFYNYAQGEGPRSCMQFRYYRDGEALSIGGDDEEGARFIKCWDGSLTSGALTVEKRGTWAAVQLNGQPIGSFDGFTAGPMQLSLNPHVWNAEAGVIEQVRLELTEIAVTASPCGADAETISYDDGVLDSPNSPWDDEVGSQIAVRFTPGEYPFRPCEAQLYVPAFGGDPQAAFEVRGYADDGTGFPGDRLDAGGIRAAAQAGDEWVKVDLSGEGIVVEEGDFFVAMYWLKAPGSSGSEAQRLGFDLTSPVDERTLYKFGEGGQWLYPVSSDGPAYGDAMIRVSGTLGK